MICVSTINSLLQLNSREDFRGRVMSVYVLFFLGSTPIGAVISGALANKFGDLEDGAIAYENKDYIKAAFFLKSLRFWK
ncbi:hypothetical protein [Campylobacter fetus]|uniref:hypothetical protein n=1 Tax=Campylobacter fetus TaxID=196 RepID=UPI00192F75B0|nr:hypothetical protein [Campylobacter fetus]